MKKKKLFIITGIVLLVLIATIIILPFAFKGKIIAKIKEEANKNLNAKVDFKSFDLTLFSSFPNFKLELNQLTVIGINEFEKDTLANMPKLEVTIDLMSVIKGENYKIKTVILESPKILAKVLKGGKANWDIAKPSADTTKATPADEKSSFKMSLQKLQINKGNIVYDDADLGFYLGLENADLSIKGDFTADVTTLVNKILVEKVNMAYDGVKYLNKAKLNANVELEADLEKFKFTIKSNDIQLNELFLGFDGFIAMPKDDIEMDVKFNAKKTDFKNFLSMVPGIFAKDFEKIETKGKLGLDGYAKGIYNDKSLPAFGLNILVENAYFKYPDLPKAVTNIALIAKIDNKTGNPDHTVIDVPKLHFEMAANTVDIKLHVATPVSDPNIDGHFKGKINLAQVKEFYPLEQGQELSGTITSDVAFGGKMSSIEKEKYDEFKLLGQLLINDMNFVSKDMPTVLVKTTDLKFSPQYVDLLAFSAKFGKSDISAKGRIDNILDYVFKDKELVGKFEATSNLMDLNEFMSDSEPATNSTSSTTSEPLSIIEVPGNINFNLSTNISKLLYDNMEMTNITGIVKILNHKATLENLKMNMLDGTLSVNGSYSTENPKKPIVDFGLDISNFDIQKTFKTFNTMQKLAPIGEKASGSFTTKMKLNTALDEHMAPVMNSMSGEGLLASSKVTVNGFEPMVKLADALKMDKFKQMVVEKLSVMFSFKDGKVEVKPFDVNIDRMKAKIAGSTTFEQALDYVINLEIPKSEFGGAANSVLNNMVSQANAKGGNFSVSDIVKVDVLIGGTVQKPIIKTGLKGAMNNAIDDLKNQVKDELNNKKDEALDKAKAEADRLKNEAEEKLRQEQEKAKAEADRLKKEAEDKAKAEADRLKKEAEEKAKKAAKDKLKGLIK